jgi:pyruvate formate lyase activating enzyme
MDPVEKKPLNHFFPGTRILSMGTAGCNMGCAFCQNFDISKAKSDHVRSAHLTPTEVVELAKENGAPHLAFTYNEPTIWGEYVIDIARESHAAGLNNVMVSNGYITRDAFFDIYTNVDAANIDLKAFTETFYQKTTLSHIEPVLETLRWLRHETDVWFEITNLVIPTLNDEQSDFQRMIEWILENLGDDVPLHFTAFHPDFKLLDKPQTPPETLRRARTLAMSMGLKYVYEGNVFSDGGDTICPGCRKRIIRRSWHSVLADDVVDGKCAHCGTKIAGVFTSEEAKRRHGSTHLHPIETHQ